MASSILSALQYAYTSSLVPHAKQFSRGLMAPQVIQEAKLKSTLLDNRECAYGKKHSFSDVDTVKKFQSKVPIVEYDDIEPYIDHIKAGYGNVLTSEPVLMLERSGGSTATTKYVPYTQKLLNEFSAATNPWLYDLYRNASKLQGTKAYWSISPLSHNEMESVGGVPIGFEEETQYFNPVARWALNQMLAVPGKVRDIESDHAWKEATALYLLKADNLGFISVWSPTFLTVLMQFITHRWSALIKKLSKSRCQQVSAAMDNNGVLNGEKIWPRLSVISCWSDGISDEFCISLRKYFPSVFIQGKGLLATEGVVSVPWKQYAQNNPAGISHGGVVSVNSHFYEFIDLNNDKSTPKLVHELERDGEYTPILTTSGGLYRYHLKDIVRCTGFKRNTPEIEFVNKLDRVSDVCGEKINANQVDVAIKQAANAMKVDVNFALLVAKKQEPLHYTLFLDSDAEGTKLSGFLQHVERYLETGHHYRYCRERGQLGALEIASVDNGWQQYQQYLVSQGQRLGDIKPTRLDSRFDWHNIFSNRSVEA